MSDALLSNEMILVMGAMLESFGGGYDDWSSEDNSFDANWCNNLPEGVNYLNILGQSDGVIYCK